MRQDAGCKIQDAGCRTQEASSSSNVGEGLYRVSRILYPASCILVLLICLAACQSYDESLKPTNEFLQEHVEWLAADDRSGRLAGTIHEAETANYIADRFLQYGALAAGDEGTYLQQFQLTGPMANAMQMENHISRNVVGMVEGKTTPGQFIILGAHYDGQGTGGIISMSPGQAPAIHNSADDNASGTAGLLYLARQFSENPVDKSLIFIAFSGEEMGLLGSRYFVRNLEISRDSVAAMINMDMIGRLDDKKLTIFGTGTANVWEEILESIRHDSLDIAAVQSGSGASDHAAFYEAQIPVLHYFTGTHGDYHKETDTAEKINIAGMVQVLEHVEQVIRELDRLALAEIEFSESTDPGTESISIDGAALGVIPDYSWSGKGFRITETRNGGAAERGGIQPGDVIIQMDGVNIENIYDYMDMLKGYDTGDEANILVQRNDQVLELNVVF